MIAVSCQASMSCTSIELERSEQRMSNFAHRNNSTYPSPQVPLKCVIIQHLLHAVPFLHAKNQAMHCYLLECCQMTSAVVLLVYTNLRKCLLPSNQHFTQWFEDDLRIFSQPIIYSYFVAVVVVLNVQLLWEYFTKNFQNLCLEPA